MFSVLTFCLCLALYPAPMDDPAQPPLQIDFKRNCGPAEGRDVFDPKTSTFHIHFHGANRISEVSEFEVRQVGRRLPENLAFRLTGVPEHANHPLRMVVGDESYPLHPKRHDKTLFKVDCRGDTMRIEFTPKGLALLKPGASFSFMELAW